MTREDAPEGPDPPARFALVLRDVGGPGDSPAEVRLRMALKVLLRRFGLRCEAVQPASSESPGGSRASSG